MPTTGDYQYDDNGTCFIYDGSSWLKRAKPPYKPFNPPDILQRLLAVTERTNMHPPVMLHRLRYIRGAVD
jgi:hypothetical protein